MFMNIYDRYDNMHGLNKNKNKNIHISTNDDSSDSNNNDSSGSNSDSSSSDIDSNSNTKPRRLKRLSLAENRITIHSTDPYIITIDNFITNEEISALINTQHSYIRSFESNGYNEYGEIITKLNEGRTSTNSWCNDDCEGNTHVQRIITKIEKIVGINRQNFEKFQI